MPIVCSGYDPARPCPVECQSQLLLDEFREFRTEFSAWRVEQSERTVKLESVGESVVKPMLQGNGQPAQIPAMIARIGERVTALEHIWWQIVGASAAVSALVAFAWHVIATVRH